MQFSVSPWRGASRLVALAVLCTTCVSWKVLRHFLQIVKLCSRHEVFDSLAYLVERHCIDQDAGLVGLLCSAAIAADFPLNTPISIRLPRILFSP